MKSIQLFYLIILLVSCELSSIEEKAIITINNFIINGEFVEITYTTNIIDENHYYTRVHTDSNIPYIYKVTLSITCTNQKIYNIDIFEKPTGFDGYFKYEIKDTILNVKGYITKWFYK